MSCGVLVGAFPFLLLCGSGQRRFRYASEEPNQPFQVLSGGRQEELLANELQPTQSHTAQADLVLQLRKQSFDFSATALRRGEGRRACQVACELPRRFVDVDRDLSIATGVHRAFCEQSRQRFRVD